jgi:hypothetical protein
MGKSSNTELGDPEVLKTFLSSVRPPMPIVYPGLLEDKDVEMIAAYLKTLTTSESPQAPGANSIRIQNQRHPVVPKDAPEQFLRSSGN